MEIASTTDLTSTIESLFVSIVSVLAGKIGSEARFGVGSLKILSVYGDVCIIVTIAPSKSQPNVLI